MRNECYVNLYEPPIVEMAEVEVEQGYNFSGDNYTPSGDATWS